MYRWMYLCYHVWVFSKVNIHFDYICKYAQCSKLCCCIFRDIEPFWKFFRLKFIKEQKVTKKRKNYHKSKYFLLILFFFNFNFIGLQKKKNYLQRNDFQTQFFRVENYQIGYQTGIFFKIRTGVCSFGTFSHPGVIFWWMSSVGIRNIFLVIIVAIQCGGFRKKTYINFSNNTFLIDTVIINLG